MTGYNHPTYVQSLSEYGKPLELPHSRAWVLERPIAGYAANDAMGCYPLFVCQDWSQLHLDLEEIDTELVSLVLITDPFGEYDQAYLQNCFTDVVKPFKEHFVIDLSYSMKDYVSEHHRRNARKALREIKVELCTTPAEFLSDWITLYTTLIERHEIKGITRFSPKSFAVQFQVPGLVAFRAIHLDETVGMLLWYIQEEFAYYHLGAYSQRGYELGASFALFWQAIEYFADAGLQLLNLGAGAGVDKNSTDGLTRFKHGWSTDTRPVYLCGRIFDHKMYSKIITTKSTSSTYYFPAYRAGEFV